MTLVPKINKSIDFIFNGASEVEIFSNIYNIPETISNEILKYVPEYVRCVHIDDIYLSSKLKKIAKDHMSDNKMVTVEKCSIFNGYSDITIKIVLDYMALYPKFTIESKTVIRDFKNRNLDTLLVRDEFLLLDKYLKKTDTCYNVKFIADIMRLALSLELIILAEKCGAIIAMYIKDKPLPFIKSIFED